MCARSARRRRAHFYLSGPFLIPMELRLPSFSGHPICADLVSVGKDVHCEFVKDRVHPEVRAGSRQTGH